MPDFFDISSQADLNLLHSDVRTHNELLNVVEKVEWEIIDYYKQREGVLGVTNYSDFFEYEAGNDPDNEIKVRLVGYDQTTPADSRADLKAQLKRVIARGTSWVLRNYSVTQGVQSIRQGQRSVTYGIDVPTWDQFPSGIRGMLKNFDARTGAYGL